MKRGNPANFNNDDPAKQRDRSKRSPWRNAPHCTGPNAKRKFEAARKKREQETK